MEFKFYYFFSLIRVELINRDIFHDELLILLEKVLQFFERKSCGRIRLRETL